MSRSTRLLGAVSVLLLSSLPNYAAPAPFAIAKLAQPVSVVLRNSFSSPIHVGFSRFKGTDIDADCIDEVFSLRPGESKSVAGISCSPCVYFAYSEGEDWKDYAFWGGTQKWFYDEFPLEGAYHDNLKGVLAKVLPLGAKGGGPSVEVAFGRENVWESGGAVLQTLQFVNRVGKGDLSRAVDYPANPTPQRKKFLFRNASSSPVTVLYNVYATGGNWEEYIEMLAPGQEKRLGGVHDDDDSLWFCAWSKDYRLIWGGNSDASPGKTATGILYPGMYRVVGVLASSDTRLTVTDGNATSYGIYNIYLRNSTSETLSATISYTPYPGDDGTSTVTLQPGDMRLIAATPGAGFTSRAQTADGKRRWTEKTTTIGEQYAFRSYEQTFVMH